jgi:hypothetical protein
MTLVKFSQSSNLGVIQLEDTVDRRGLSSGYLAICWNAFIENDLFVHLALHRDGAGDFLELHGEEGEIVDLKADIDSMGRTGQIDPNGITPRHQVYFDFLFQSLAKR